MSLSNNFMVFAPIFIMTMLVLYPNDFIVFSHSLLGKLMILLLIVFYSYKDIAIGILVCLLSIVYYQNNIYETMLNYSELPTKKDESTKTKNHLKTQKGFHSLKFSLFRIQIF
jgi:hypothetical protein